MKTILSIFSLCGLILSLNAQPQRIEVEIYIEPANPPWPATTNFLLFCDKLANHDLSLRASTTLSTPVSTWYEPALYVCYPDKQTLVGTYPYQGETEVFFRSIQNSCPGSDLALLALDSGVDTNLVVMPYVIMGKTSGYRLLRGRTYEVQQSSDGVTWQHRSIGCNIPESLIKPGVPGIGICGDSWWFLSDTSGGRLRFLDVTPRK